jgi:hypothetical protein
LIAAGPCGPAVPVSPAVALPGSRFGATRAAPGGVLRSAPRAFTVSGPLPATTEATRASRFRGPGPGSDRTPYQRRHVTTRSTAMPCPVAHAVTRAGPCRCTRQPTPRDRFGGSGASAPSVLSYPSRRSGRCGEVDAAFQRRAVPLEPLITVLDRLPRHLPSRNERRALDDGLEDHGKTRCEATVGVGQMTTPPLARACRSQDGVLVEADCISDPKVLRRSARAPMPSMGNRSCLPVWRFEVCGGVVRRQQSGAGRPTVQFSP